MCAGSTTAPAAAASLLGKASPRSPPAPRHAQSTASATLLRAGRTCVRARCRARAYERADTAARRRGVAPHVRGPVARSVARNVPTCHATCRATWQRHIGNVAQHRHTCVARVPGSSSSALRLMVALLAYAICCFAHTMHASVSSDPPSLCHSTRGYSRGRSHNVFATVRVTL